MMKEEAEPGNDWEWAVSFGARCAPYEEIGKRQDKRRQQVVVAEYEKEARASKMWVPKLELGNQRT